MGSNNSKRKLSAKKIQKAEKSIRRLKVTPQAFSYVNLYHDLIVLHFQGEYDLVSKMCDALMETIGTAD